MLPKQYGRFGSFRVLRGAPTRTGFFAKDGEMGNTIHRRKPKVIERDGNQCRYCGKLCLDREIHIDHIVPKSQGGKDDMDNLATSCKRCNGIKGAKNPKEFLLKMKSRRESYRKEFEYADRIVRRLAFWETENA